MGRVSDSVDVAAARLREAAVEYAKHASGDTYTSAIILHWAAVDYAKAYSDGVREKLMGRPSSDPEWLRERPP